jgi:hypothetical protein
MNVPLRLAVLLLAVVGAGTAWAEKPSPPPPADTALPDSVRRVERQTGGEVIRAEPMQRDGREVYRMKVLTRDGRVRVVQDDPQAQPARKGSRQEAQDRTDRSRGEKPRDEGSDPT